MLCFSEYDIRSYKTKKLLNKRRQFFNGVKARSVAKIINEVNQRGSNEKRLFL